MSLEEELEISPRLAAKLRLLGFETADQLSGIEIGQLIEGGLTWSSVKALTRQLVKKGLKPKFEAPDVTWNEGRWHQLVEDLVASEIVKWEEVAVCVLGELNPPQVGTSIASNPNIQRQYPHRRTMQAVMDWFYSQPGTCANCGRRLHLEADHIKGKNEFIGEGRDQAEADRLDNLQLLCKRCNVVKRESHLLGGLSFHTAQAALMWILLVKRPATLDEYSELCRRAGLTMADIRFQEAWAMAQWLERVGKYQTAKAS
jgi:hypothetical protein